jgi:chromosome segregation ATPase
MEDFLISTDMDRILEILRRDKSVEQDSLSRELGMPPQQLKKWISVLEEQHLVHIEYKLTKVVINWSGKQIAEEHAPSRVLPSLLQIKADCIPLHLTIPEDNFSGKKDSDLLVLDEHEITGRRSDLPKAVEIAKGLQKHIPAEVEAEATEIVQEAEKGKEPLPILKEPKIITKKKSGNGDISIISPAPSMLANSKIPAQPQLPTTNEMLSSAPKMSVSLIAPTTRQEKTAQADTGAKLQSGQKPALKQEKKPELEQKAAERTYLELEGLPQELSARLKEVRKQADEIARLRGEKERLLREVYMPLQTKLEAEVGTIAERLLEKEKQILQLQNRAAEIPAKTQEIEKQYMKLQALQGEARTAFDDTTNFIEQEGARLRSMHEQIEEEIESLRANIEDENAKISGMGNECKRLSSLEKETKMAIGEARKRILLQTESVELLDETLKTVSSLKRRVNRQIAESGANLISQSDALETLQNKLSTLAKAETYVDSHFEQYKREMSEFNKYVENSSAEYDKLRESVEANFARLYLGKLRNVADKYQFELESVQQKERDLDMSLEAARARMSNLIRDGMKMVYSHETQKSEEELTPEEMITRRERMFASLAALSKERTAVQETLSSSSKELRRTPKGKDSKSGKGK